MEHTFNGSNARVLNLDTSRIGNTPRLRVSLTTRSYGQNGPRIYRTSIEVPDSSFVTDATERLYADHKKFHADFAR